MCPHSLECFLCDGAVCHECHVLRCGSSEVAQWIADEQPSLIFFDFDRTLATTRTGADPLATSSSAPGLPKRKTKKPKMSHSVDPFLKQAAAAHARVHVVTRNNHTASIRIFLAQHGLGHLEVHSLRASGKAEKAGIIRDLVRPGETALFCDDSFQEIVCESMRELVHDLNGSLTTILFTGQGQLS
jgi:hypothetical protein